MLSCVIGNNISSRIRCVASDNAQASARSSRRAKDGPIGLNRRLLEREKDLLVATQSILSELEEVSSETREYVTALIAENDDLRSLADQKEALQRSLGELHAQCLDLHDSESKLHNELGRIYISASQLSSSISRDEIVLVIQQIVANLIGSEEIVILSAAPECEGEPDPEVLSVWGLESDWSSERAAEFASIKEVLQTGTSFYVDGSAETGIENRDSITLNACVVLRAGERVAGAVAIFRLLPQKEMLTKEDRELCELVATLGGQALYCSELHARLRAEKD